LRLPGGNSFSYTLAAHPQAAVHVGWLIGMASMAGDIVAKADSAYRSGTRNLYIMGHSQGGAIAYLLTAHLRQLQQAGTLPADLRIKTYCSAAPKPGNTQFAYAYERATFGGWAFNVINSADWVPETPFSIQALQDFNKLNPFAGAAATIKNMKFPARVALKHVYNRLLKTTAKADKTYRKYLGKMVGKRVHKLLPGLQVPAYFQSNNYVRTGAHVVLLADSAYFNRFPDTSRNVFTHHLHAAYLYLLEKLPDEKVVATQ
jgi:pimeloyl-ACP methyl ester carboxylesterase